MDEIRNEDGHSLSDLRPDFAIPTLEGYLPESDLIDVLDLHDIEDIEALERIMDEIETSFVQLHLLMSPTFRKVWLDSISSIWDNVPDIMES